MPVRLWTFALLALLAGGTAALADDPQYTLGDTCGGAMTGFDGRQYNCGADRKPACEASTGQRCRCLERRECGGKRDEPF